MPALIRLNCTELPSWMPRWRMHTCWSPPSSHTHTIWQNISEKKWKSGDHFYANTLKREKTCSFLFKSRGNGGRRKAPPLSASMRDASIFTSFRSIWRANNHPKHIHSIQSNRIAETFFSPPSWIPSAVAAFSIFVVIFPHRFLYSLAVFRLTIVTCEQFILYLAAKCLNI